MIDEKQPCEKCGRKLRPRWILNPVSAWVGPTCRKHYIRDCVWMVEDFTDTKPKKTRK